MEAPLQCNRCNSTGHTQIACKLPNDPNTLNPALWTSAPVPTRQATERAWILRKSRIQQRFDSHYWHPATISHAAPTQSPIPSLVTSAINPAKHNHEVSFATKLPKRISDKAAEAVPKDFYVIRPGFGTKNPAEYVLTNHFPVALPSRYWKYTIGGMSPGATRQKKKVMVNSMILCAPFLVHRRNQFAWDGNDQLFAWTDLFLGYAASTHASGYDSIDVLQVPMAQGAEGQKELITMNVRCDNRHGEDMQHFKDAIAGDVLTRPGLTEPHVTALNAIISLATVEPAPPALHKTFAIGANKFFLCQGWADLGKNPVLQTHTGFFSTIKPGMGQALLNLNIATSAFYKPQTVSSYLDRVRGNEIQGREERGLRGVRVYIDYLRGDMPQAPQTLDGMPINKASSRVRSIGRVGHLRVDMQTFMKDGQSVRLVDYLLGAYSDRPFAITRPDLHAINLGTDTKPEWYCPEHLKIMPFQPWKGLIPSTLSADMIKEACRLPGQVKAVILERGRGALGITPRNNATLTASGLTIGDQMMLVPVRQLNGPVLSYRYNSIIPQDTVRTGQWNLNGRLLHTAGEFKRAHFYGTARGLGMLKIADPKHGFFAAMKAYFSADGKIGPTMIQRAEVNLDLTGGRLQYDTIKTNMASVRAQNDPKTRKDFPPNTQVLVWINPDKANRAHYNEFRKATDRDFGIPSLCITEEKLSQNSGQGQVHGFAANNAMKINLRVGGTGINHMTTLPMPGKATVANTMIIGADVTHPNGALPGTGSIATLVGTIDGQCAVYRGVARPNPARVETISAFKPMLSALVKAYVTNQSRVPANIVYYRDGVSDSQYAAILSQEVDEITAVFAAKKLAINVTAIVVTKRHHTRFYRDDNHKVLNTPPGTCVDSEVTHPTYFDFFLQSHKGLQGTAKPAHYFVLKDDLGWSADQLQSFTHSLCYRYGRSSTSVSYATPTYYADRLCARIRCYFSRWFDRTQPENVPTAGRTQEEQNEHDFLREWGGHLPAPPAGPGNCNPWHPNLDDTCFWM